MPIIEIDGVGKIEVDDSFLSLNEADQASTIDQIVSQTRQRPPQAPKPQPTTPTPQAPGAPPQATVDPTQVATPAATNADGSPVADIDTNGDGIYSDEEYAAAEAAYQSGAPLPTSEFTPYTPATTDTPEPQVAPEAPAGEEKVNDLASFGIGVGQGLTFNFGDEIAAGADALDPMREDSIWRGGSFKDTYDKRVKHYRDTEAQAAEEDPFAYWPGQIGGSLIVPGGAVKSAAQGVGALSKAAKATGIAKTAGKTAVGGAIAGAGADEGGITDRLDGAALGGAIGAAGGAVLAGGGLALSKDRRIQSWVAKEVKNNPHAAMDAEIVSDLVAARNATAKSKTDMKGRADLTAKEINDVQDSYTDSTRRMIQALDLKPSQKNDLIMAMERKFTADDATLNSLRGTVEGDAVVDGILRTQRLRSLTPEIKTGAGGTVMRLVELASGAAGAAVGGPLGSPVAALATRQLLTRATAPEAARASAANRLLSKSDFYKALGDEVGPSATQGAKDNLIDTYGSKMDAASALQKLKLDRQAAKAEQKALQDADVESAASRKAFRSVLPNTELRPQDLAERVRAATRKETLKANEKGVHDSQSALTLFNLRLKEQGVTTSPAKRTPKVGAVSQAIDDNVAAGIPGQTRTQDVISQMVGVPKEDMLRGLAAIRDRYPSLQPEIDRIALNWNTKERGVGNVIAPAIKKALEEDGTMAKIAAQAEEAQVRMAARQKMMEGQAPVAEQSPALPVAMPKAKPAPKAKASPVGGSFQNWTKPQMDEAAKAFRARRESSPDGSIGFVGSEADDGGREAYDYLLANGYEDFLRMKSNTVPNTRANDPTMTPVSRPEQWAEGRDRYQAQAGKAIDDLMGDSNLPDDVFAVIGNAPQAVMQNHKTTADAISFIDDQVIPDLRAEGVSNEAISRVRQHLISIANAKPYRDQAAYDAGTRAKP